MKLLLDTHTFIWWDSDLSHLSPKAVQLCQDCTNTLVVSVASIWEMQIKLQLGKLTLKFPLSEIIAAQQQTNHIKILPIQLNHVLALESLSFHHKDPFDRILIAQANSEGAILLSCDPIFLQYPVNVAW